MAAYHQVQQGECLSTIARQYGFAEYHVIYDHPKNALLKQQRPNPNVLLPGDCLYIPDKQVKQEARSTTQRHVFQISGPTVFLRLRLQDEEESLAGKRYVLKVDDAIFRGCTGAEGRIEQRIPVDAKQAELTLWLDDDEGGEDICRFPLAIGRLDPAEALTGVQARLHNLGFDCGPVDGINGPMTKAAVQTFQQTQGLTVDGIPGRSTQTRLREVYGC